MDKKKYKYTTKVTFKALTDDRRLVHKTIPIHHNFEVILEQEFMGKITFRKPFAVIFEGRLSNRTVFVSEINVLKSGKASFVRNKEGERFNYEFLDEESKKMVDNVVERNKKYL